MKKKQHFFGYISEKCFKSKPYVYIVISSEITIANKISNYFNVLKPGYIYLDFREQRSF